MQNQPQNKSAFSQRAKGPLDNEKLKLYAPCTSAPGKVSALSWSLVKNCPRISIYTNDPADNSKDTGYGKITANMSPLAFFAFLELIEKAIVAKETFIDKIENLGYSFFGGKRSENPVVLSETVVGRDKDGVVWMSVIIPNSNRPRIKFPFGLDTYQVLKHGDGSEFTLSEASTIVAKANVSILKNMFSHVLVTEWVDTAAERAAKAASQGGGNNYSQKPNDKPPAGGNNYDEDVPF